jgi:integrase
VLFRAARRTEVAKVEPEIEYVKAEPWEPREMPWEEIELLLAAGQRYQEMAITRGGKANPARTSWHDRRTPMHELIATVAMCGLRIQEALHIRLCDVDLDHRRIFLGKTKGGKKRYVYLCKRLASTLEAYIGRLQLRARAAGQALPCDLALFPYRCLNRALYRVVEMADLPARRRSGGISWHDLRHAWAQRMRQKLDVDLEDIGGMMGHSQRKTMLQYQRGSGGYFLDLVDTAFGDDGKESKEGIA